MHCLHGSFGVEKNAEALIASYDVVVDGSDNFPTRYLVNDACVLADKPLVHGAIQTFQGQVSVFNHEGGPTYRCLFPEPPNPDDAPNCSELGVVGVLPGLVGLYQATEAIKLLAGVGELLSGKLLLLDALDATGNWLLSSGIRNWRNHALWSGLITSAIWVLAEDAVGLLEVEPRQLQEDSSDYQLLDVREDWEWAICGLPGAHLPLGQILSGGADFSALGLDTEKPTYVYWLKRACAVCSCGGNAGALRLQKAEEFAGWHLGLGRAGGSGDAHLLMDTYE